MIRPTIHLRRRQIIVDVDTQKHFFLNNSPVCVRNHLSVLANIRRVIAWTRLKHIHTISTVQIFPRNIIYHGSHIAGSLSLKKINCTLRNKRISFEATDCTDLPKRMSEQYDQVIFHKRLFDPFEEPRADRMFTELDADEFILIGALAEGAVKATALGLLARWKKVTVLVDAIGTLNAAASKVALRHMWAKGARLTNTKALLGCSSLHLVRACR
ncbi:MAG: cysteine hydrolase family protein [Planctomycetota bacterium]